jgi:hypothetical protein
LLSGEPGGRVVALVRGFPLQHDLVVAVAIEIRGRGVVGTVGEAVRRSSRWNLHVATWRPLERNGQILIRRGVRRERERLAGRELRACEHRANGVDVRLREIRCRVDEIGGAADRGAVEFDRRAAPRRAINVESDVLWIRSQQTPADVDLGGARPDRHHASSQVLHDILR